ncbi:MAG: TlpA disulfide reductase family protein [Bacteroidales bacterium]
MKNLLSVQFHRIIILMMLAITFSCAKNKDLQQNIKGNWLNANDSIEWVLSFQPGFAVFNNEFYEYQKILGTNEKVKIVLKNQKRTHKFNIEIIDDNTISVNSPGEKGWKLTKVKAVDPNFRNYDQNGFGNIQMVDDTAVIIGFIEDYDPELYIGSGYVELYHALNGYEDVFAKSTFNIDPAGKFEVGFRAFNPQMVYLTIDGSTRTQVLISPGDTIIVAFNKLLKTVTEDSRMWDSVSDWQINHYMGSNAMPSEEITLLNRKYLKFINPNPAIVNDNMNEMPQLEYLTWRKEFHRQEKLKIDSLLIRHQCSKKAQEYYHKFLENELLEDLYNYQINGMRFQNLGPEYTDRIEEPDEPSLASIVSTSYMFYINYLSMYHSMNPLGLASEGYKKYYLNYLLSIAETDGDQQLIKKLIEKQAPKAEDFDYKTHATNTQYYDSFINRRVKEIYADYYKIIGYYWQVIPDSIKRKSFLMEIDPIMLKYQHSIFAQLYAASLFLNQLYSISQGTEASEWILQNIPDPVIKKVMLERIDQKIMEENRYNTYAENTFFISQIKPSGEPVSFFDRIIKQFKGKVIYVDFWADWCSPCREGFKSSKKLQQVYAGKDVVFLYFGYSCKNENWNKAIKQEQISGYHYWLDNEQTSLIREKFNITGIPHYLLIDKNGQVVSDKAPHPSDRAEIMEKINKLLK